MSRRKSHRARSEEIAIDDCKSRPDILPFAKRVPLMRAPSHPIISVDWADGIAFWIYYLMIMLIVWCVLWVVPPILYFNLPRLTVVNVFHSVTTLYLMHLRRGAVGQWDGGDTEDQSFWEILDNGRQYTFTKKFFTTVPILLCIVACYEQEWKKRLFCLNIVAMLFCVVPKLPCMDGVRLFGWD